MWHVVYVFPTKFANLLLCVKWGVSVCVMCWCLSSHADRPLLFVKYFHILEV